jgi:predicted amidohydrolase
MKNYIKASIIAICISGLLPTNSSGTITVNSKTEYNQVKIAMAQILCIDGDLSGNFARIENAIIEAKEKQAEIIVFPESSLLGWENPDAHRRACPIPGKDSEQLCNLARKYKVYICIGLDEKAGEHLFDSAVLIDDNGNILLNHRKINVLPELMDPPYSVGDGVQVVKTRFGNIGVMICADSFMENLLDSMKAKKPDLLLIPYGWAAPENAWPAHGKELEKVVKNVAGKVGCPVIGTNLIGQISHGPWKGQVYGGQSVAFDEKNNVLVLGKDRDRDLIVITIEVKNEQLK